MDIYPVGSCATSPIAESTGRRISRDIAIADFAAITASLSAQQCPKSQYFAQIRESFK